jgi:pimeloyl-ACP methyl ester carboxylesterase
VNPQSWNRYAYGRNNPLSFVDIDGNVAVGYTGLQLPFSKSNPNGGIHSIGRYLDGRPGIGPAKVFRHTQVARGVQYLIDEYQKNPTQPVIVFGHSRGASAAIQTAGLLQTAGIPVDLLITIDPVLIDPTLRQSVPSNVRQLVNFYESESPLQGTYMTGDFSATDVENHQLPSIGSPHSSADEWVLYSSELIRLVSELQEEQRRKESRLPCPKKDPTCIRNR